MAECPNCGAGLRAGAKRCLKCGSVISQPAEPAASAPPSRPPGQQDQSGVSVHLHVPSSAQPEGRAGDRAPEAAPPRAPVAAPVLRPHRGTTILVLAILSWFNCLPIILPIITWAMANTDLREMRAGIKDPSGSGLAKVSKVLAIIVLVFQLLGAAGLVIALIVSAVQNR